MEDFFDSFIGKTIRWIVFLPVSIIALEIIDFLVSIFVNTQSYLDPTGFMTMTIIFYLAIRGGIPSFCFVYIGASIAPHFKKVIAIFLSILIIGGSILNLFNIGNESYVNDGIFGILSSWRIIIVLLSTIIGAIIGVIFIFDD